MKFHCWQTKMEPSLENTGQKSLSVSQSKSIMVFVCYHHICSCNAPLEANNGDMKCPRVSTSGSFASMHILHSHHAQPSLPIVSGDKRVNGIDSFQWNGICVTTAFSTTDSRDSS